MSLAASSLHFLGIMFRIISCEIGKSPDVMTNESDDPGSIICIGRNYTWTDTD